MCLPLLNEGFWVVGIIQNLSGMPLVGEFFCDRSDSCGNLLEESNEAGLGAGLLSM